MKNRIIFGIIFIVLGALIAFGPQTIFPVCGVNGTECSDQGSLQAGMPGDVQTSTPESTQTSMAQNKQTATQESNAPAGACVTSSIQTCFWTARAELGIGILIALLGVLLIVIRSEQTRTGLGISLVLNGILALLIPTVLIGVCDDPQMTCRLLALPALTILSSAVILAAALYTGYLYKSNKKGQIQP